MISVLNEWLAGTEFMLGEPFGQRGEECVALGKIIIPNVLVCERNYIAIRSVVDT